MSFLIVSWFIQRHWGCTFSGVYVPCIFTCMSGENRRLRSLLLFLCYVFRALINSLVCWFCTSTLGLFLFHIFYHSASFARILFQAKVVSVVNIERWQVIESQVLCLVISPCLVIGWLALDCLVTGWPALDCLVIGYYFCLRRTVLWLNVSLLL